MARRFGTRSISALTGFLLCTAAALPAEAANPVVSARVDGVDDEEARSTALRVESMDVSVRLHGGIGETVVTVRLHNSGTERLEGRFELQMPAGSIVTGYALDVGGVMIDGVLVDQIKARRAYEARLRERIDPGLGEISRAFQFSTRVYPIEEGSSRTVRVRFVTPLAPGEAYALPLESEGDVGRLSVKVEAAGAAPRLLLSGGSEARWTEESGGSAFTYRADQVRLAGTLTVARAPAAGTMLVGEGPGGERFFEITDSAQDASEEAVRPRSVAIYWDRSLSRADDNLAVEIELVKAWVDHVRPETVDLVLFDASGAERVRLAAGEVAERLRGVTYRGATSFAAAAREDVQADACLVFTDGLVTVDRRAEFRPRCPLFAISSGADADRPVLGALARANGGEALHLGASNQAQILGRLTRRTPRVVRVRSTAGAPVEAVLLDAPGGGWRLVGPMPASGGVAVGLSGLGPGVTERTYSPAAAPASWSGAAPLWAADRLAVRAAAGQENRDSLVAFAGRYSVGGPDISFLVLETARDYADAGIEPPANLPAERLEAYRELVAERAEDEAEARQDRLGEVLEAWDAQKKWWNTRFNPGAKADPREMPGEEGGGDPPAVLLPAPPPPPPPPGAPAQAVPTDQAPAGESAEDYADDAANIVVSGTVLRRAAPPPAITGQASEPEVTVAEWAPDRPYLAALKAAPSGGFERVLAEQQAKHGGLPAFWLDVSEFSFRAGRREEARRLLLSALELPTRNTDTLAVVAGRLLRYGDPDRAIELFEAVAAAEPDRPQPLRSLALALAKRAERASGEKARADLARAIALLTQVVMRPWDDDFEGIETIALMEVNRLIPRYRALGGADIPLDPRLIALLDGDIRIVVEWDTEETDLDLWVDEPNKERARYDNPETRIGGRMSEDMTSGYGPEEYLLRRAPQGTFTVRADVFATDALNPNGASRITARLIRDFGRPSEREELIELELLPPRNEDDDEDDDEEGVRLLGKIRVRR